MNSVAGSLHRHSAWWREHVSNNYIIDTIENGYRLPLLAVPEDTFLKNNKSALDNSEFVTSEIQKLVQTGALLFVQDKPTVVNALTVATNASGKNRLVLDLRTINPLLLVPSYKYEDVQTASAYFKKDSVMATFDLKSGYHHVSIHKSYQQYMGLCWNGKYYIFSVCPFGMSVSGLIFTKIVRELVRKWRTAGIAIVMYIDDGIIVAPDKLSLDKAVRVIRKDLLDSGFIVNNEKSHWEASQTVAWLGFQLDSKENVFIVPAEKMSRLKKAITKNLKYAHACSAREISRTVGKIGSLFVVFGSIVYVLTKECTRWISARENWSNRSRLPISVVQELEFWIKNIGRLISRPLEPVVENYTHVIYSDASATGCGAVIAGEDHSEMIHSWTENEKLMSSTWREAQTILLYIRIHALRFKGGKLKWYSDNQGVPPILHKGSMKPDLNLIAMGILQLCIEHDIQLSVDWIPRDENAVADTLSKLVDSDDWAIANNVFFNS